MGTKKCSKCGIIKDYKCFSDFSGAKDGLQSYCKDCVRDYNILWNSKNKDKKKGLSLKSNFNISLDDYNRMFTKQRGLCLICGEQETVRAANGKIKYLAVDHIHNTDIVRGLLCNSCNTALGLFKDSTTNLESAIKYLKERGTYGE